MLNETEAAHGIHAGAEGDAAPAAQRIRVPKTSELVADQIRAQIVRGDLQEGDSLPPEGQLMASLGISRPTLREAFRILETEQLISVVRGSRSGARVHRPSIDLVARYAGHYLESVGTTIADLYQARQAIEPQVVRWLAENDRPEATTRLRQETKRLRLLLEAERVEEFLAGVNVFHGLLVEVAGNRTLTFMNRMLLNLVARHQADHQRRFPRDDVQRRYAGALKSYEKVIDLIEARDVDAAVAHWRLHLVNAEKSWTSPDEGRRTVNSLGF